MFSLLWYTTGTVSYCRGHEGQCPRNYFGNLRNVFNFCIKFEMKYNRLLFALKRLLMPPSWKKRKENKFNLNNKLEGVTKSEKIF